MLKVELGLMKDSIRLMEGLRRKCTESLSLFQWKMRSTLSRLELSGPGIRELGTSQA